MTIKPNTLDDIKEMTLENFSSITDKLNIDFFRRQIDVSFGELSRLYVDGEINIAPEYQRFFRWSQEQRSKFIESIYLNIPIPTIFLAENKDQKWEVIDGVQRLSTVFAFLGVLKEKKENNLKLKNLAVIKMLNDKTLKDIPEDMQRTFKRSTIRIEIIKTSNADYMKYELFKRLNTTGEPLSLQEIRNCILSQTNNDLNKKIITMAQDELFINFFRVTNAKKKKKELESLILGCIAFSLIKDSSKVYDVSIEDLVTEFIVQMPNHNNEFNEYNDKVLSQIKCVIKLLTEIRDTDEKNKKIKSKFFVYSVMYGVSTLHIEFDKITKDTEKSIKDKIEKLLNSKDYFSNNSFVFSLKRNGNKFKIAQQVFSNER